MFQLEEAMWSDPSDFMENACKDLPSEHCTKATGNLWQGGGCGPLCRGAARVCRRGRVSPKLNYNIKDNPGHPWTHFPLLSWWPVPENQNWRSVISSLNRSIQRITPFGMVWFGHRFWYENSGEQAFTEQQLAELKKVKCCRRICRTPEEVIFPLYRWVWLGCCATMQKTSARFSLSPSRYIHMTKVVQQYL